ncbi:hypothetical protein [Paenibacillus sp. GCM10012306]|uniref:hypothetical protein n=1 Tax=Paenibacillus sp. GCM10012306 TaxID=3317342 RepID=UPI00360AF0F2
MIKIILDEFFQHLSDEDKLLYSKIADQAEKLGYKPRKAKTQALNFVFKNNKTKKHIMKFSIEKEIPVLKMKFYASLEYSYIFHDSVRFAIEEYNYKYTGCYNGGKCLDELEGYQYKYDDGRTYFRCGSELISLPPVTHHELPEILKLLNTQHQYYLSKG